MRYPHLVCLILAAGCGGDDGPEPMFAVDYADSYVEVRTCSQVADHDLHFVKIYASSDAVTPYTDRVTPFPVGAAFVKEEYARTDDNCAGTIVEITAMQRVAVGSSPDLIDWRWQRTDAQLRPVATDESECATCHTDCPDGYSGTCLPPP